MRTFGYSTTNDIIPEEAEIISCVYDKAIQYAEHPPEYLVNEVIDDYRERGEHVAYEEAEKRVVWDKILQAICDEVNEKWQDYYDSKNKKPHTVKSSENSFDFVVGNHIPIIDEETYKKAKSIIDQRNTSA